ncbi:MAG: cytochrome P450 [Rhodospirillaceae bacterium]|nr:cytochrome P450 [Rhodospirillaceae bacterium]
MPDAESPALIFDPLSAEAIRDPYTAMAPLQAEAPAYWSDVLGAWVVTRYDDIRDAFRDPRLSSDRIRPFIERAPASMQDTLKPLGDHLNLWAVFTDPPDHTRLRGLMNRAFTTRAVEALRPEIARIVNRLLDDIDARIEWSGSREFDLIHEFAYPLPALVIAHMLGVPERDVDKLKRWSDLLAKFVLTSRSDPQKYRMASDGIVEMEAWFRRFLEEHRASGAEDVTTGLLDARDEGDRLTTDELVACCVLLLFAGHETTTQLLANGMRALIENPAQMADLRAHLDDIGLVRNAVEEMLRFDGPSLSMVRVATEDFEWHGRRIATGERLFLMMCIGNRDPRVFPEPDRFDIRRDEAKKNFAFGYGIHFCIGAPLARLEAEIAFPLLLRRYPEIAMTEDDPPWSDSILNRGMLHMRVRV